MTKAAQLATATAASLRETAALEAQIAALHAAHAPTPQGGYPNSREAEFLVRLGLPRARLPEAAHDVTVLCRDEVAALMPETEISVSSATRRPPRRRSKATAAMRCPQASSRTRSRS